MSHSTVVVFFKVLVGICITHVGTDPCAGPTGTCIDGSWRGLVPYTKCDTLERDNIYSSECPPFIPPVLEQQTCCVDCDTINKTCNETFRGSVGRTPCCPGELQVYRPYPINETPCCCCQSCQPNRNCLKKSGPRGNKKRGFCVTEDDPVHNVTHCHSMKGWRVHWDWCEGDGCGCCHYHKHHHHRK